MCASVPQDYNCLSSDFYQAFLHEITMKIVTTYQVLLLSATPSPSPSLCMPHATVLKKW